MSQFVLSIEVNENGHWTKGHRVRRHEAGNPKAGLFPGALAVVHHRQGTDQVVVKVPSFRKGKVTHKAELFVFNILDSLDQNAHREAILAELVAQFPAA